MTDKWYRDNVKRTRKSVKSNSMRLTDVAPRDMSRFDPLSGNLLSLIINVVAMLITAAFLEEFLWRGYLMERLIDLQGNQTWLAWVIALVGSAAMFGFVHYDQGVGREAQDRRDWSGVRAVLPGRGT